MAFLISRDGLLPGNYHRIGSKIHNEEEEFIVVKDPRGDCDNCAFDGRDICESMVCCHSDRPDGKDIIFKRVEK